MKIQPASLIACSSTSVPPSQPPPEPDQQLNGLILAEFDYIAKATIGSSEDRARVSNYYIVTIGAAIAAIFSDRSNSISQPSVNTAIGVGFFALALLGCFTLMTLIRLRAGWIAGANAMDRIKEYYARIYPAAVLDTAFEWKREDLPPPGKPDSVAFWTAASVIIVDSAIAGLAAIYWGSGVGHKVLDESLLIIGVSTFLFASVAQAGIYWWRLPCNQRP